MHGDIVQMEGGRFDLKTRMLTGQQWLPQVSRNWLCLQGGILWALGCSWDWGDSPAPAPSRILKSLKIQSPARHLHHLLSLVPPLNNSPVCRGPQTATPAWSRGPWAFFTPGQRSGLKGAPSAGGSGAEGTVHGVWPSRNPPDPAFLQVPKQVVCLVFTGTWSLQVLGHLMAILLPLFSAVVLQENRASAIPSYLPCRLVQNSDRN